MQYLFKVFNKALKDLCLYNIFWLDYLLISYTGKVWLLNLEHSPFLSHFLLSSISIPLSLSAVTIINQWRKRELFVMEDSLHFPWLCDGNLHIRKMKLVYLSQHVGRCLSVSMSYTEIIIHFSSSCYGVFA